MLSREHRPVQVPAPGAEACPRCGVIDRPTLTQGSGPHAIKASCGSCGHFLRWVSILSPSERIARRAKARHLAMQKLLPTSAQVAYLRALGHEGTEPASRGEASALIAEVIRQRQAR